MGDNMRGRVTFGKDNQIWQRPLCGTKDCPSEGFVGIGDKVYCGKCAITYQKKLKEAQVKIQEEMSKNV